jgi:hypothetical protein
MDGVNLFELFLVLTLAIVIGKTTADLLGRLVDAGLLYLLDVIDERREVREDPDEADEEPIVERKIPLAPRTRRLDAEKAERIVRNMP